MKLEPKILEGDHVRLEPVTEAHQEEMRKALDCDPDNWQLQVLSAQGEHFDLFWRVMTQMPDRISFAVRDKASGRIAGTSSHLFIDRHNRTLEIGTTWFRPEFRGTAVNPEAKLLMLGHAFDAGALRVQFGVDSRNARSQAAVLKLGAKKEAIIRRHKITWTGHKRDTALFSIIDEEWEEVRQGLQRRLQQYGPP